MPKDDDQRTLGTVVFTTQGLRIEIPYPTTGSAARAPAPVSRRPFNLRRPKPPTPTSAKPPPIGEIDPKDFPPPKTGGPGSMVIRPIEYELTAGFELTITQLETDLTQVRAHEARELAAMLRNDLSSIGNDAFLLLDVKIPNEEVANGIDPTDFAALVDPAQGGMHAVRLLWDTDLSDT